MRAPVFACGMLRTVARTAIAAVGAAVMATTVTSAPASAQTGAFVWYDSTGESHVIQDPNGACIELVPAADPSYPVDNATDTHVEVHGNSCFESPLAQLDPGDRKMLSPAEEGYHIRVWPTD